MEDLKINFHDNIKMKDALKLHHKSGERLKTRNKPIREMVQYVDDDRTQIITKERTEEETKVYHEGKITRHGKCIIHHKHLRSQKKHKYNE